MLIGLILLLFYSVLIEPFHICTKKVKISDSHFVGFFRKYRTIFLSDIHVSWTGIREKILLQKIQKFSPDIIFITGDFVSWGGDYEKTFEFISKLKAKVGIWAVLGDSDYQDSRRSCIFCHSTRFDNKKFAVCVLRDQTIFLPVGDSRVAISGVELFQKNPGKSIKIIQTPSDYPQIILSHKQFDLSLAGDNNLVVLSGDTHGGQSLMPDALWGAVFAKDKGKIRSGMISNGSKTLIVSKGIGTNRLPLRFLCPPEIVLFEAN